MLSNIAPAMIPHRNSITRLKYKNGVPIESATSNRSEPRYFIVHHRKMVGEVKAYIAYSKAAYNRTINKKLQILK
ncbi:hypothetical protein LBYZC6_46020 [Lacrimispora brassicae]